jgi:hypothetical protein
LKWLEALSLNQMTVQRYVDVDDVDESTYITSTAQMCIFVCGVTPNYEVCEELVDHSIQGQTMGQDFIQASLCTLQKHNLE